MAEFHPRQIIGKWREGYALDVHTVSSIPIGHNEFGHMQFETTRSAVGELLFRLKNRGDRKVVDELADTAVTFLQQWNPGIDIIVPVPASNARTVQPVALVATAISARVGVPLEDCITKTRKERQLKNVFDLDERLKILDGLHAVNAAKIAGRRVLLFDDLYRSGATMNSVTALLLKQRAEEVFALAITRTRSFR
ncbi:MAG TPA: phosphoribosyltransferase family protein [Stellaceae bacterium]|nr:phosphoribosyltransferase family protein [Stellaceae bacterium]